MSQTPASPFRRPWLLALFSGLLLSVAWPPLPFSFLLFVALVPLFHAWEQLRRKGDSGFRFWAVSYLGLLLWNILTTWWVGKATLAGGIFANVVNPLLMTLPLLGHRYVRRNLGDTVGWISLVVFWVLFEFLHMSWELTWPWLTLGNGFAWTHSWVQWYEYSGHLGGTVWMLAVNILLYTELRKLPWFEGIAQRRYGMEPARARRVAPLFALIKPLAVLLIPLVVSLILYARTADEGFPVEAVVVQPNYEPHFEKFTVPLEIQLEKLISLSDSLIGPNTDYVIWPETSLPEMIFIDGIESEPTIRTLREFRTRWPRLKVITGINGYERIYDASKADMRAKVYPRANGDTMYLHSHNTAIQIDAGPDIQVYHKGKLVPGPEILPFYRALRFLENYQIDMPGLGGNLIASKERGVFRSGDTLGVAPVICYESIFGDYLAGYVRGGANLIVIVTNDGWWGNTSGHRQHNLYAKLRAIETRRSIARSANTGTSCFIDQRGDVHQATTYGVDAVLVGTVLANDRITAYVRHGDWLGRTSIWLGIGLLLLAFVSARTEYFKFRVNKLK